MSDNVNYVNYPQGEGLAPPNQRGFQAGGAMRKRRRGTGPLWSQQRDVPVEPRDGRGARVGRSSGSPALFVEGLELFEAKLGRQRLGLGRCKWWGAGGEALNGRTHR